MGIPPKSLLIRPPFRKLFPLITIPICLILTLIAFRVTLKWEDQKNEAGFQFAAEDRFSAFQREIESNLETLLALKALYSTSPKITRSQFHDFVATLLSHHPSVQALEWIPRVTDSQREAYEAEAKRDGFTDFEITERGPQKKVLRANKRKEYFPVYFVEPYKGNESALGFDLASNPTRLGALALSRGTGEMVATGRITLVQETGNQFGFLVFVPVYRTLAMNSIQESPKNLDGFVLGVFRIADLLEKSLTYLKPEEINIYLYDKSAAEQDRFLYFHETRTETPVLPGMAARIHEYMSSKPSEYIKMLELANRKWQLRYTPTPNYVTARRSWQCWGVLFGGLLLTGLLATYFMISHRRTAELRKSNDQLRLEIDQRKRAEEEVKNLAKFPSENPNPVLRLDPEGLILYANASSQQLLKSWGCSVGAYVPSSWRQLLAETLRHQALRVTEVDLGGIFYTFFVTPIPDAGYVNLYGIDITARRQSEELYTTLTESSEMGIYIIQDGKFRFINSRFRKFFQLDPHEPLNIEPLKVIHPEDREKVRENAINMLKGKLSSPYEYRAVDRNGQITWVMERVTSIFYEGRRAVLANAIDISTRKQAEEQLQAAEDRYRDLVENSQDIFCIHDLEGNIMSINPVPAEILGYERDALLRMNIRDILAPEIRDQFPQYLDQIRSHGNAKGFMSVQTARGERRIWEYNNTLRKEGVTTPVVRALAHDITERKRAEEALLRSEKEARRLSRESGILAEIGQIMSSTLDIDEVYEHFVEVVQRLIQFDRIAICITNPDDGTFTRVYLAGPEVAKRGKAKTYPLAGTGVGEVMQTRSSLVIQDENQEQMKTQLPGLSAFQDGFQSMMLIPLISKDQVVGALNFQSLKANAYAEKDISLGERIANQIAGTFASVQLFRERERAKEALQRSEEATRRIAEENEVIARIGRIISSTLDIGEVYERFAGLVKEIVNFDRIMININNPQENTVTVVYTAGVEVPGRRSGEANPFQGSVNEEIVRTRSTFIRLGKSIAELAEIFPALLPYTQSGLRSEMGIPLISKDEVIGVLHFQSFRPDAYAQKEATLAEKVANQIAGAIANAELYKERQQAEEALRRSEQGARRLAEENASMARIGQIINSSLRIEEVYTLFSEEVNKLLPSDRISINLIEADQSLIITEFAEKTQVPGRDRGMPFPMEGTMTEAVTKSRKGLILDIQDEKEIELKFPGLLPGTQVGLRSFLSVPLISGDQAIGALNLRSKRYKAYSERDLELAENIARQIAEAITNARLYDDLKQTAEALRRSESLLRNVLDLLPVGVGIADKDGRTILFNPARARIWGGAEFTSFDQYKEFKGWWTDTGEKLKPEDWPLHRAVTKGEVSIEKEIDIECFDGAQRTILSSAIPIRGTNQEIIGGIGVNQDISERKQVEERLKKSEEHFRKLLENSSDFIITVDRNRIITYVSSSVERIMGYKPEEMVGKEVSQLIHPEDWPTTREAFLGIFQAAGATRSAEHRARHKDGTWPIHQIIGRALLDDPENPLIILNGRDINQAKLLERQLAQAQKLEAVGQLAAGIAHEINTPTQYVGDNTRFMQDSYQDLRKLLEKYQALLLAVKEGGDGQRAMTEVEETIREIDLPYLIEEIPRAIQQTLEGVERVTKIVRAMKEFSHPGTKEKTLADINKAIENTLTVSRNEWKYVADLVTEFDSSLPPVPCLLGEFNQAILNMVINAAHAIADVVGDGAKGKGTIKVSTRRENGWAEVRISDTGTGIPENIRTRIFDPFFTTKKIGKGTGQGLAISHAVVVKNHGGTINLETEVGKGTTFIIRLPLADGVKAQ